MKIGILTYYGDLNCGTNLQAYATLLAIEKAHPNDKVEIIPFHGFKFFLYPYKSLRPYAIRRDLIRIKKYEEFKRSCLKISKDKTILDTNQALDYIDSRHYDRIYVGADTLLELDRLPKGYDGLSAYWLKDIKAEKFLIAASAKNVEYEKLSAVQRIDMETALKQFTGIAVRDRATVELLSHFMSSEHIHYIPDPTFTLDIDYSYIENYISRKHIHIPKKSVFIQFFGNDIWVDGLIDQLHENDYKIVVVRPHKKADFELNDIGPLEQLGLYRYVDFVITHRFHDCVFSLKNGIPFLVYINKKQAMMTSNGNESKQISITKDFQLFPEAFLGTYNDQNWSHRIIERMEQIRLIFRKEIINSQLSQQKKIYWDYLTKTSLPSSLRQEILI